MNVKGRGDGWMDHGPWTMEMTDEVDPLMIKSQKEVWGRA